MIPVIKQRTHERVVDFLNTIDQYGGGLKKITKQRESTDFSSISTEDINKAVMVLIDVLNLSGGSVSDVDLYVLLQAYFQKPSCREKINILAKEVVYL